MSGIPRHAKAKKANAKFKQAGRQQQQGGDDSTDDPGTSSTDSSSTDSSGNPAAPPSYVLFDGREDLLLYWQAELDREAKEEILHIEVSELNEALIDQLDGSFVLEEKRVNELVENGELMTLTRCAFIDAIYEKGEVKLMKQTEPSIQFILYTILGVLERHTLLTYERQNTLLRFAFLLLFYIWCWSHWSWYIRYPLILLLGFITVAASNAATISLTPSLAATQTRFWSKVAEYFLLFKYYCLKPFDDPYNPILLRCRAEIFMSALIVLELATWQPSKRYYLLIILTILVPFGILKIEKGRPQRNKTAAALFQHTSTRSADASGLRYLRSAAIALSNLIAIYFCFHSWIEMLFVSFFFFPNLSTIILSLSSIAIAGFFVIFSKVQTSFIGDYARRNLLYWMIWCLSLLLIFTGWSSSGWMIWLASYFALLIFTPPLVSNIMQILGGGLCALLLSVGVHVIVQGCLKVGQILLTKEGTYELFQLFKASIVVLAIYLRDQFKKLFFGEPTTNADASNHSNAGDTSTNSDSTSTDSHPPPPYVDPNDASEMN